MDFEMAQYRAARKKFPPETKLLMCSFHMYQKIRDKFRKIFKGTKGKRGLTDKVYPVLRGIAFIPWYESLVEKFTQWLLDTCNEELPEKKGLMKRFVRYLTKNKSTSYLNLNSHFSYQNWPWAQRLRDCKFSNFRHIVIYIYIRYTG